MKSSAKSYLTTGVAIVGAGVITAGSIAPPPEPISDASHTHEVSLMAHVEAAQARQALAADLALLDGFDPAAALLAFIEGTIEAFERPGPVPYTPTTGPIDGLSRIGQGFAASGLRLGATVFTPLRFVELLPAVLEGNGLEALAALVENIVDGPLWVVDPALYGLRDALPFPLGGTGGLIESLRNDLLWALTQEISAGLTDPIDELQDFIEATILAYQRPGPVPFTPVTGPIGPSTRVLAGAIATGLRLVEAAVRTPLGVVALLPAIAEGAGPEAVADLIENIVDGPLWVADPLVYALRDALPAPYGGAGALVESLRDGVWSATEQINAAIRSALGVSEAPASQAADDTEIAAADTFSGPAADSTLNSRARVVNLPSESEPAVSSALDEDAPSPEQEPAVEDPQDADEPADDPKPDRNLVRNSPNFSTSVEQNDDAETGGDAAAVEETTTPSDDADSDGPDAGDGAGDTTAGGAGQDGSDSAGGDKA
ncbi:hypothetical protein H7I53_13365 [Mycolicibacterium pulveris]|uniref:Uncharacterized protein n=1 Tax=Mycolicibacterium pulveris TaxID=36813 RepID=A0A7I7UP77_MYCPV|nr:hypothetical protein [Mycolicibacterium pulveris]MCV6981212.1 hypothetical protein [Mycolicibacterium pulveris]BBY82349.1 hypothetical protein MPUL_35070 [Mycolicibacterium pulveris]